MLTGRSATLQLHPTLRCNLSCVHCYSSSGPTAATEMDADALIRTMADAAELGFRKVAVSGGEPLVYRPLRRLLAAARDHGMLATVTTNGMLLTERRLDDLGPVIDFLAVSVDGWPDAHNLMRGSPRAFSTMQGRLEALRERGVPFGFIFTLTRTNADQIAWIAQFAEQSGARAVQIHPLTMTGRAGSGLRGMAPDGQELFAAVCEAARLRRVHPDIAFQVDAVTRSQLVEHPTAFVPDEATSFPRAVPTLVVDADGVIRPLTYDIADWLHLGNVEDGRLSRLAAQWMAIRYRDYRDVLQRTHAAVLQDDSVIASYWFDAVAAQSQDLAPTRWSAPRTDAGQRVQPLTAALGG